MRGLAKSSGVPTPTREELVRFDRKRKKKTSNREWVNPHDPDAKITKLKDGRTRLGHKVEEVVDLETGAVVAVTAPEKLGEYQAPVYANRRRIRGRRGRRLQRRRSEWVERPFAHRRNTGGLRRIFVRGHANVRKRLLIHVCGFNLALLMRRLTGVGTPRSLQGRGWARLFSQLGAKMGRWFGWNRLGERLWSPIGPDLRFGTSLTHQ